MKSVLLAVTALNIGLLGVVPTAQAEDSDSGDMKQRIQKLEDELALLKRQQEVKEEKDKAIAEKAANVSFGAEGLKIASPDNRYSLKMRAYAQADSRTFFDNSNVGNVDQFLLRTARPIFDVTLDKEFAARFMMDFGNGQTQLLDAYADYKPSAALNFRVGKFKAPIGLDRWQSEQEILFVERGMANNLVPFRDIGIELYGELIPQTIEYQLAFTDGAVDLGNPTNDTDNAKDVTGRVFVHPFRNSSVVPLQGLGVGIAGSIGNRDGSTANTSLTEGYRSPSQAKIFTYRTGSTTADISYADGTERRINPQTYYSYGPFGFLGEYVATEQDVRRGSKEATLSHDGFTTVATYLLTGENASFDGVKPRSNFNWNNGTWGAWELLARYGELHLDDDAFPLYADSSKSVSAAYESTLGLTWYLNPNIKVNANLAYTQFDGGAAKGADREDEKVLMTRTQMRF